MQYAVAVVRNAWNILVDKLNGSDSMEDQDFNERIIPSRTYEACFAVAQISGPAALFLLLLLLFYFIFVNNLLLKHILLTWNYRT
jgi:hypothetical protein